MRKKTQKRKTEIVKKKTAKKGQQEKTRKTNTALNDKNKTKDQLIKELAKLRRKLSRLETQKIVTKETSGDRLRESESKFRNLVTKSLVGVYLIQDGIFKYSNQRLAEIFGYTPEELINRKGPEALVFPEDWPAVRTNLQKRITGEIESIHYGFRGRTKNNRTIYVEVYGSRTDFEGKSAVIGSLLDITERRQIETELTKSAFYLDSAGDAIIVINAEKEIIKVNKEFSGLWGYTREETLGKSVFDFFPEKERSKHKVEMEKAIATKLPRSFETFALTKEGREVPLSIRGSAIFNQNGEIEGFIGSFIIGSFRDITERKKDEAEREDLLKELMIKNKELEQLIYVTSHDLRSPMVNIYGFSKELAQSIEELKSVLKKVNIPEDSNVKISTLLDRDIKESKEFILASIAKMDTLLSGLLRVSRLGRIELNKEKIDMNSLIAEVTDSFEFQLKKFGIELDISELPECIGDKVQINQMFSNLIDNALKYMDPERAGIIKISGSLENGHSVYCVEDNGIGIEREHQDKVFEIFHQLDPGMVKGEGLGLTIVQKVIEKHNGKVWLESEPGKGSRFYVSLPT
jgi:PAS domain S-box-containing protein